MVGIPSTPFDISLAFGILGLRFASFTVLAVCFLIAPREHLLCLIFKRLTRVFCSNSQMKSPGITTCIAGKNKTLYMQTVKSIEQRTKENLKKTLKGKFK